MIAPTWDIAYTTDDVSDTTPSWTTVSNTNIRSVSVSRGREDELGRVDAGTATLVLNNRTRLFDPLVVTGLRPMNRWRIRAVYNAVTYDVFLGYAESYEQQWPATGKDAITVVRLVDEFKRLALELLPVMDPPVPGYADVVKFDQPQGYWRFQDQLSLNQLAAEVGNAPFTTGTIARASTALAGDPDIDYVSGTAYGARSTTERIYTYDSSTLLPGLDVQGPGDAAGLSAFTFETWFKSSEATPASGRVIALGPTSTTSSFTWFLLHTATGKVNAYAENSGGTGFTATGSTTLSANTWYHVAIVVTGANTLLYINGVQDASASFSGSIQTMGGARQYFQLGETPAPGGTRYFDEPAFYRYALPVDRVLAHYTAGTARGFTSQDPGDRVTSILSTISNPNAGTVQTGTREMIPAWQHGQTPIDELRKAEYAENVDAILYISQNGSITFLADGHRSSSPWNTVQATFDDDGTDLPYIDAKVDYSETFLYNDVQITRVNDTTNTYTDSTSVSRYAKRTLQYSDLPLLLEADAASIGAALLAKYKDPMTRITSITVSLKTSALISACLALELAERIRILRTPVGGGTRIDQTSFIQSINLDATPDRPWQLRLGVSPL